MRNVILEVILKPFSFLLKKFNRKQKKTSASIIILGGIQIDNIEVNVYKEKSK